MKKDTLLGHVGRDPANHHGTINTPVFRASTIVFPDLETYSTRPADDYKTPRYGIHGNPTTWALEEAVAKMEGGYNAVAVCSGLAAINAALCAFVKAGDHLLITDSAYGPTRTFCDKQLTGFGVQVEYYDPLIGAGINNLIKTNTKAIFCEAPGSLSFEMQDIPAIASVAHACNIPVLADTTWGTPYFFRSFEHGVDVSIHAGTKYIVGHSDVMLGMIVTNEKYWLPVRRTVAEYGYCSSADDCYLALRGFRMDGLDPIQIVGIGHVGRDDVAQRHPVALDRPVEMAKPLQGDGGGCASGCSPGDGLALCDQHGLGPEKAGTLHLPRQ